MDATGSVDELVAKLRDQLGMAIPGADIMLSRSYDELTTDVVGAAHVGRGVIDGVECDHLAFRNHDVDWQLWVEHGSRPVPRKYVITSKEVTAAPQYTLRIKEWKTDVPVAADAFSFNPPAGSQKVDMSALANLDEQFRRAWCREKENESFDNEVSAFRLGGDRRLWVSVRTRSGSQPSPALSLPKLTPSSDALSRQ